VGRIRRRLRRRHPWANSRPSQRDLAAARKIERQAEIDRAIAEGRLMVRKMTAEEREQSAARRAAAKASAGGRKTSASQ
jgi:hypothetical protein